MLVRLVDNVLTILTDVVRLEAGSHKGDPGEYVSDSGFCSM